MNKKRANLLVRVFGGVFVLLCLCTSLRSFASDAPPALASLQAYSGLLDMPNARVLPDWNLRVKYGKASPYAYYGVALGLFDRLEIHGQFAEVDTITAFPGHNYGAYKDRSGGVRLVLLEEDELWPQIAVGVFDATGTALFGSRYLVMSKLFGDFDITFGLGQGILAGEFVGGDTDAVNGEGGNAGYEFLFSSPLRKTRPFGGAEWHVSPELSLTAEYSSYNYQNLFGFVDWTGKALRHGPEKTFPINVGLKYRITPHITAQAAVMRGGELAYGLSADFPLDPEGVLDWKKPAARKVSESTKWKAQTSSNEQLAQLVAGELFDAGFSHVETACSNTSLWVETETHYLSEARAIGRIGRISDELLPQRITQFYINIAAKDIPLVSFRVSREVLNAFLEGRIDKDVLLAFSDLDSYVSKHRKEFKLEAGVSEIQNSNDEWYELTVKPKVRTFLNNKEGFFKHKVLISNRGRVYPWKGGLLTGTYEIPVYNEFDEVDYNALEKESARTDLLMYEGKGSPRLAELSFDQIIELPENVFARVAVGYFESAYAGVGAEAFRFFDDGRFGVGVEVESVRKRAEENNFALRDDCDHWWTTAFLNLYAQVFPQEGIEAGLKIGRFLGGDWGARFELRRSFKYFTLGAWYTKTDTSVFESSQNRGAEEKGVFIQIPFSVFFDHERKGSFDYGITSFSKDQGQIVRQPRSLYPMNRWDSPDFIKRDFESMRD